MRSQIDERGPKSDFISGRLLNYIDLMVSSENITAFKTDNLLAEICFWVIY